MVEHCYPGSAPTRNVGLFETNGKCRFGVGRRMRTSPPKDNAHATMAIRSRLLGACDADGKATADVLVRAVPDHPYPLSAVMALVDEGMLEMDRSAAFGAETKFRRTAYQIV